MTTRLLDDMVQARLPWTSETLRTWYSDHDVTAQLASWLDTEASRVGNTEFGRRSRDAIGF